MYKKIFFLFCIAFSNQVPAQYSMPDIGESRGNIVLAAHTLRFSYQGGHISSLQVVDNHTTGKKLAEAYYTHTGLIASVTTFYANGKKRSEFTMDPARAYSDFASFKKLPVLREPLLNLPLRYYLEGTGKRWTADGKICTITRFQNNRRSDSVSVNGTTYALDELGTDSLRFSIHDWLYEPALLEQLLREINEKKLPPVPHAPGIRFNPYDHIGNGMELEKLPGKKSQEEKKFTRVLEKYRDKGELISFKLSYTGQQIAHLTVVSEMVTTKDREVLTAYLLKTLKITGIRINDLLAPSGEIGFYFHMGC